MGETAAPPVSNSQRGAAKVARDFSSVVDVSSRATLILRAKRNSGDSRGGLGRLGLQTAGRRSTQQPPLGLGQSVPLGLASALSLTRSFSRASCGLGEAGQER
jgi:hypothetical protein